MRLYVCQSDDVIGYNCRTEERHNNFQYRQKLSWKLIFTFMSLGYFHFRLYPISLRFGRI